jgi:ArsR family transcriptional regulator, arsenate/arsenite/antimonite-responsive transcriptional repressor
VSTLGRTTFRPRLAPFGLSGFGITHHFPLIDCGPQFSGEPKPVGSTKINLTMDGERVSYGYRPWHARASTSWIRTCDGTLEIRMKTAAKTTTKKTGKGKNKFNQQLARIFKSLADENRIQIVQMLMREGKLNVTKICDELGESQPAVSHHLNQLKYAELVDFEREGKFNHYYISSDTLKLLLEHVFPKKGGILSFGDIDFSIKARRSSS